MDTVRVLSLTELAVATVPIYALLVLGAPQ